MVWFWARIAYFCDGVSDSIAFGWDKKRRLPHGLRKNDILSIYIEDDFIFFWRPDLLVFLRYYREWGKISLNLFCFIAHIGFGRQRVLVWTKAALLVWWALPLVLVILGLSGWFGRCICVVWSNRSMSYHIGWVIDDICLQRLGGGLGLSGIRVDIKLISL